MHDQVAAETCVDGLDRYVSDLLAGCAGKCGMHNPTDRVAADDRQKDVLAWRQRHVRHMIDRGNDLHLPATVNEMQRAVRVELGRLELVDPSLCRCHADRFLAGQWLVGRQRRDRGRHGRGHGIEADDADDFFGNIGAPFDVESPLPRVAW